MTDTFERLRYEIAHILMMDVSEITMESSLIDDLGADSLDLIEIMMAVEEEFGIEIPDDEAKTVLIVRDAVRYLEKAQAA